MIVLRVSLPKSTKKSRVEDNQPGSKENDRLYYRRILFIGVQELDRTSFRREMESAHRYRLNFLYFVCFYYVTFCFFMINLILLI